MKYCTCAEAVAHIRNNAHIYVHGSSGTPTPLLRELANRLRQPGNLTGVEMHHILLAGDYPVADPDVLEASGTKLSPLFISGQYRTAVNAGVNGSSWVPMMLHDIPHAIRSGDVKVDCALVTVSPPDEHGYVTLGGNVVATLQAFKTAQTKIGVVNPGYPRALGDGRIHVSEFTALAQEAFPLHEFPSKVASKEQDLIASNVADLIGDGDCLQTGFGGVADAVLGKLGDRQGLGIHTEMLGDGAVDLLESGVADNSRKQVCPGETVASFALGTRRLYSFIDNNPAVTLRTVDWTNDPRIIAQNNNVVAINGAIEVDLTGQIVADSMPHAGGSMAWSGVGGQIDFMQGALWSRGGRPVTALPAVTGRGASRIVPRTHHGAGVVTSRYLASWVVTEHGKVNLHGKTVRERARGLISIAAPEHREELTAEARKMGIL